MPDPEKELVDADRDSGVITRKRLGYYDPSTHVLKMYQRSLLEDCTLSLLTLPKMGMMRNGLIYELVMSERLTEENDYSLLPTPTVADIYAGDLHTDQHTEGSKHSILLIHAVKRALLPTPQVMDGRTDWRVKDNLSEDAKQGGCSNLRETIARAFMIPTPTRDADTARAYAQGGMPLKRALMLPTLVVADAEGGYRVEHCLEGKGGWKLKDKLYYHLSLPTVGASEYKGSKRNRFKGSEHFRASKMSEGLRTCKEDPIYLNPCFAEVVMGFPAGWTELDALGMESYRKLRSLSGKRSRKQKKEEEKVEHAS
jgi:hypothetical protein